MYFEKSWGSAAACVYLLGDVLKSITREIVYSFTIYLLRGITLLLLFAFNPQSSQAQKKAAPEYQVKAAFLYNFTQFVDWPSDAFPAEDSPFVIGIIGTDPFGEYLEEIIKGENIGGHPIVIKRYELRARNLDCHLLFINSRDPKAIREIVESTHGRSILTVSDAAGFERYGGIVRFFTENNKVRFKINSNTAKPARLNISSKLLAVART